MLRSVGERLGPWGLVAKSSRRTHEPCVLGWSRSPASLCTEAHGDEPLLLLIDCDDRHIEGDRTAEL